MPEFREEYLRAGHAVHFRCRRPDVHGLRIDVMSSPRGLAPFDMLWQRRTVLEVDGETVDVLAIHDLVLAKKTQRNKDWPMIQRLVEQHYFEHHGSASSPQVEFWLRELRTPELLIASASEWPEAAARLRAARLPLAAAIAGDRAQVEATLAQEESNERAIDRAFWEPLRRELEQLRRGRA